MSAMSETEARAKRCVLGNDKGPCIASMCMAWRWFDSEIESGQILQHQIAEFPVSDGWRHHYDDNPEFGGNFVERPRPNRRGYCGLAGVPTP